MPSPSALARARSTSRRSTGALARRSSAATRRCAPRFVASTGEPVQIVAPEPAMPLPVVDLAGSAGRRASARRGRLALAEARRPFDLARGPAVARDACSGSRRAQHVLALLDLHHIVARRLVDGGAGARAGGALRRVRRRARPRRCPSCRSSTRDFAAWQRSGCGRGAGGRARLLAASASPGRRRRSSCPPTARARPSSATAGARSRSSCPPELSQRAAGALPPRAGRRCSWRCWRRSRCCWRATRRQDGPRGRHADRGPRPRRSWRG